jgi:hypothetical protein
MGDEKEAKRTAHVEADGERASQRQPARQQVPDAERAFVRAENEDDDGYDPYSDRPAKAEPLFERDPWD